MPDSVEKLIPNDPFDLANLRLDQSFVSAQSRLRSRCMALSFT
jgi:hypothetical protein